MKLLYIANARIPTEKAHGLHIVKMCEALAGHGAAVTLVLPQRKNTITENVFSYYKIKNNFKIQYLPIVDLTDAGFLGYWLTQIFFSWKLLISHYNKDEYVVITRDELSGWIMRKMGFRVFYDMHGFPVNWLYLWKVVMKKMTGIICTNEWKMRQLHEHFAISQEYMLLARNGFDKNEFLIDISKFDARKKIGLPLERKIIMYTGHLYDWKGVDVLAEAAGYLEQALVVFVGGTSQDIKNFTKRHKNGRNLLILGQKSHSEIPFYLNAADVLVLPNSRESSNPRAVPYSIYDTSPIKLFEYMASNRPIVASDLPSIREILNEDMATFFKADNSNDLAEKINRVLNQPSDAERRASQALEFVQQYTWEKRAESILKFIDNCLV